MGTKTNTGFTIIETMLFLAVAGALTVGILAGSGLAINQQRYRDSVNSLKSFIQQQYNETANVVNDRTGVETCDSAAAIASPPSATQSRGTSECVILGRYITIDQTGTEVKATNVVGYRTPNVAEEASDFLEIKNNYTLGISTIGGDVSDVAWGAVVIKKQSHEPLPISMLILRSPLSGAVMTYATEGVETHLQNIVKPENSSQTIDLCMNAPASSLMGHLTAVRISPFATNQGSVQIPPETENVCG